MAAAVSLLAAAAVFVNPVAALALMDLAFMFWGLSTRDGGRALDPPIPDFDYREEVTVVLPAPPGAVGTATMPPPLLSALAIAQRFQAIQEALDRIGAKILGARIDGADDAVRVQLAAHRSTLTMLRWAARSAPGGGRRGCRRDVGRSPVLAGHPGRGVRPRAPGRAAGGPPDLAASTGLPPDSVDRLQELVATKTDPVDLAATIRQLGSALVRRADTIQTEADEILRDQPPG